MGWAQGPDGAAYSSWCGCLPRSPLQCSSVQHGARCPVQPKCVEVRELGGVGEQENIPETPEGLLEKASLVFRGLIERNSGGEVLSCRLGSAWGACHPSKTGVQFASE